MKKTKITFIICSRNDNYMGNSMWRLQTSINYLAQNLAKLNKLSEAEIIVSDWGSAVSIRKVLHLNQEACEITNFLEIPPDIVQAKQKDSPFSEVHALNAAARRAHGEYIGRIDQDTLVGSRFLKFFF